MESQQIAPHHHHEPHTNVQLHQSVEGELEDGQHHEKKSVLKKVKAKAKKIKDTITKHGHGHDHDDHDDHDHDEYDHHDYEDDEDDSEDEDEVIVEDPQLQGAPLYEGAAMRGVVGRQGQQQDVGIGIPTTMHNEPVPTARETTSRPPAVETGYSSIDKPTAKVVNSAVEPNTTMSMSPWSLVEDPHSPKDKTYTHNFEVKASDPAGKGSEEAGESQMFDAFAKMEVNEEDKSNRTNIALEPYQAENQSSYTQRLSAMGSAMSGTAMAAKDFMASKLGYGETTEHNTNTEPSSALKKIAITVTEKLKPGEEDRALSNVISEAFIRRKEEMMKVGETAFRQDQHRPRVGKVTESDELTRWLGRENEEKERSGTAASAVKSVADTVKDTMGSWLGNVGDQSTPSQQSLGSTQGVEGFKDDSLGQKPGGTEAEVRILQGSAN